MSDLDSYNFSPLHLFLNLVHKHICLHSGSERNFSMVCHVSLETGLWRSSQTVVLFMELEYTCSLCVDLRQSGERVVRSFRGCIVTTRMEKSLFWVGTIVCLASSTYLMTVKMSVGQLLMQRLCYWWNQQTLRMFLRQLLKNTSSWWIMRWKGSRSQNCTEAAEDTDLDGSADLSAPLHSLQMP